MGLPLFVAPVESDLPPKSSKRTTSPQRSSIRRPTYHGGLRDRVAQARRARQDYQERRRPMTRALEAALGTESSSSGMAAAAEYIRNGFMTPEDLIRPSERDSARHAQTGASSSHEDRRNQGWDGSRRDARSQWWMFQPQVRPERQARADDRIQQLMFGLEPPSPERRAGRIGGRGFATRRGPQRTDPAGIPADIPTPLPASSDDHNGLGDRNRSISPEGWDTLLSTLTPDPQPPSANSSFASTAATVQNPSASFTSSSQTAQPGSVPEPPCESGCENSDTEEGDLAPRRRHRISRAANRPANPVGFEIPDFSSERWRDAPIAGLTDMSASMRNGGSEEPTPRRPVRPARAHNTFMEFYTASRPTLLGGQRDGWVGQLSVGASDENSGTDGTRPQPDSSASFASLVSAGSSGEEDLTSLQRIVRGLASREDIPDEWWSETGLSRTLTRDRS